MNKQVLVISYYFPPMGLSGVQRTLKFVKYLPYFGWDPVVVTTNSAAYYAYDDTLLDDLHNEIKIYRTDEDVAKYLKSNPDEKNLKYPSKFRQKINRIVSQAIFQPDSRILWKKHAIKACEKAIEENNIQAIFATAPPFTDFLVAKEISDKYDIPYMIDYRDLWIDNAFYVYVTPFHKNYSSKLEAQVLNNSSKIIVITRHMKEMLIQRYSHISHDDIKIIPHGFDPEDFDGLDNYKRNNDKFTITHSGLFPDDLTPQYFLEAVAEFIKQNNAENKISLKFIGIMRDEHIELIEKYNLTENTELYGYISHREAIQKLIESDILWFMITNNIATPSRMFEYIGSRKPFIACVPEGNIRDIAENSEVARTCDPKDVNSIYNSIQYFYNLWKNNNLLETSYDFVEQYDRKKLTELLALELELIS
jgi:glycosyltransferase involved in cell wall biosynthesis